MGSSDWVRLPNLILVEIFSYLNRKDRIQASSVNSQWRYCLFYPKFWSRLLFKFTRDLRDSRRSEFLLLNISFRCLLKVTIVFDNERQCLAKVLQCLRKVASANNLRGLRLKPRQCVAHEKSVISDIVRCLEEIIHNAKCLTQLDLGFMEGLSSEINIQCNDIQSLNIASVRHPNSQNKELKIIKMKMLASLANLTTLHLNYEQFSDDLLQMFCQSNRTPLNVLHLIIANVDRSHPGTTNELWSKFVYVNPSCRLEIDVICNEEAVALLDSHILQPAMPLSKFSTYFCEKVNEPALEFLSQWYNGTLNCLNIVDSLNVDEVPPLLVEDHFGRVDPLIMIAWKCHSLESLTLIGDHGYLFDEIQCDELSLPCFRLRIFGYWTHWHSSLVRTQIAAFRHSRIVYRLPTGQHVVHHPLQIGR